MQNKISEKIKTLGTCATGRDQEDHGSRPVQVKYFGRPYIKMFNTKGLAEWFKW
jgi:hypothetical protein